MAASTVTRIQQTVFIPAPPDDVYAALVQARKHAQFTGAEATGAARKGGRFTAWDGYIMGRHLDLSPGKRILQEWMTTEWPDGAEPSLLEFQLKKKGRGTELKMIHSNVPRSQAEDYRQGWKDHYWEPLKAYFGA